MVKYSPRQLQFLREEYKTKTRAQLIIAFNQKFNLAISLNQLISCLKNHKINSGRSGHFLKGQTPWNTGTKGVMKPNAGTFKKGSLSHNQAPIGTEILTPKDRYIKIKTEQPNTWQFKHKMVWQNHHGEIPKGKVVAFINGDKNNCDISNLELIDRATLCVYNKMQGHQFPPELRQTVRALGNLKIKTANAKRELRN